MVLGIGAAWWMVAAITAQLPLEPATPGGGERWHEEWWRESRADLPAVPGLWRVEVGETWDGVRNRWTNGLTADDTTWFPGMPAVRDDANGRVSRGAAEARASVVESPARAEAALGALKAGGSHAVGEARGGFDGADRTWSSARDDVATATDSTAQGLRDTNRETRTLKDETMAEWSRNADTVRGNVATETRDAVAQAKVRVREHQDERGQRWDAAAAALAAGRTDARDAVSREPGQAAAETRADTAARAAGAARNVDDAFHGFTRDVPAGWALAGSSVDTERARARDSRMVMLDGMAKDLERQQASFDQDRDALAEHTVLRAGPAVRQVAHSARVDATALWHQSYDEYLRGGMTSAADNGFAGDLEGGALAGWYAVSSVTQAGAILLFLEPLAAMAHLAAGSTVFAFLGGGGTLALGVFQGVRLSWLVVTSVTGAAVVAMTDLARGTRVALEALGAYGTVVAAGTGWLVRAAWSAGWGALSTTTLAAVGAARVVLVSLGSLGYLAWAYTGAWVLAVTGQAFWALWSGTTTLTRNAVEVVSAFVLGTGALVFMSGLAGTALLGSELRRGAFHAARVTAFVAEASWTMALSTTVGLGHLLIAGPLGALGALALGGVQAAQVVLSGPARAAGLMGLGVFAGASGTAAHVVGASTSLSAGVLVATALAGARGAGHTTRLLVSGTAGGVVRLVAPFRFDLHNEWSAFRRPQLEEMLAAQPQDVRAEVGTEIRYVRVNLHGEDRGKVLFFQVHNDGRRRTFVREVNAACEVHYVEDGGPVRLEAGVADGECRERSKS